RIEARIEDPQVAARSADAVNLGACGMLTHPGKSRPDRNARNGLELHEIDNGHVAVGGGDVSGEMQVRPKERWSMLAEQQDDPADSQRGEQETDAEVFGPDHKHRLKLYRGKI